MAREQAPGTGEASSTFSLDLLQRLGLFLLVFATFFVMEGLDSFGLSSAHDAQTVEQTSFLTRPLASILSGKGATLRSHPVTVLLIDQKLRDDIHFDTPFLSYSDQANAIYSILGLTPEAPDASPQHRLPVAIFLDLRYSRYETGREEIPLLVKAIQRAQALGVDVYTGPIVDNEALQPLRSAVGNRQTSVSWPIEQPADVHQLDYPMSGDGSFNPEGGTTGAPIPTAAAKIYSDLCARSFGSSPKSEFSCGFQVAATSPPLFITYLPFRLAPNDMPGFCKRQSKAETPLRLLAQAIMPNFDKNRYFTCLDVPAFSLADITRPHMDMNRGELLKVPDATFHDAYIADKVVMIGDGLGNDRIAVPYYGVTDGVIQHALALQTLLSQGANYTRWPPRFKILDLPKGMFTVGADFLIEWAIVFCSFMGAQIIDRTTTRSLAPQSVILAHVQPYLILIFCLVLSVTLSLLLMWSLQGLHWPVFNMLTIVLATFGLTAIAGRDRLLSRMNWGLLMVAVLFLWGLYRTL